MCFSFVAYIIYVRKKFKVTHRADVEFGRQEEQNVNSFTHRIQHNHKRYDLMKLLLCCEGHADTTCYTHHNTVHVTLE